jgi:catechol 2,3-dioxygenase-like lactoylglutathione lyase family enzyme
MKIKLYYFSIIVIAFFAGNTSFAQVRKVEAIGITVDDMDRSVQFYSQVLQFKKVSDIETEGRQWEQLLGVFGIRIRVVRMKLGDEIIELIDYLTTGGRSIPEDAKSNDLSFQHIAIVVSDMDSAYRLLRRFNVPHVSTGPQTLPASIPEAAGIKAFYFQDPDKHNLEIIYFPKGKGQDKWQQAKGRIFLGIDHTAIGISNTTSSHTFYQDNLGIERKGDSWNKGIEQEHLNNVEGASLHITGYRSAAGPGVEFLEYLLPGAGRKYPIDTRSDDIWNWYTIVHVDNVNKLFEALKTVPSSLKFVSKEVVTINQNGKPRYKAFIVRDPDGHAVLIKELL